MRPILFEWGPLVVPSYGFFMAIGFLFGSFFLWRRLKDEYPEEDLLSLSLVTGLFGLLGARAVSIVFGFERFGWNPSKWLAFASVPGLSFYGAFAGVILGTILFSRKLRFRFWEVWDGVWEGVAWMSVFLSFGAYMSSVLPGRETTLPWGVEMLGVTGKRHPIPIYFLLLAVVVLIAMTYARRNYRKFRWYPSGKVGFVGLFGVIVGGAGLLILESLTERGIYFGRFKLEQFLALLIIIVPALIIYHQSGRKAGVDKSSLSKSLRGKAVLVKQKIRSVFRRS